MTEAKNEATRAARKGPAAGRQLLGCDVPPGLRARLAATANGKSKEDCWLWTGSKNRGYGIWHGKICGKITSQIAHRAAFAVHYGEAPAGLVVRHTCDTPECCNPHHLELGTQADNGKDMVERGRTMWAGTTPEQRKEMRWHMKRGINPFSKPVIGPDGRAWPGICAAAEGTGWSPPTISRWSRERRHGWRFA